MGLSVYSIGRMVSDMAMEQFKEWFERYKNLHPEKYWPIFDFLKPSYEKDWRTALKWAKSMHGVSNEPRFNLNITEELGD